jgi:hypothetical protein
MKTWRSITLQKQTPSHTDDWFAKGVADFLNRHELKPGEWQLVLTKLAPHGQDTDRITILYYSEKEIPSC